MLSYKLPYGLTGVNEKKKKKKEDSLIGWTGFSDDISFLEKRLGLKGAEPRGVERRLSLALSSARERVFCR